MKRTRLYGIFPAMMLFAFALIAGPSNVRATLIEGSYNITGTCTIGCSEEFTFSGMFDIDSGGDVQNFMMEFDDLSSPTLWTDVSLSNVTTGTMFAGFVEGDGGAGGVIAFGTDGAWVCSFEPFCTLGATADIEFFDGGAYEITAKVPEPPTVALFAFGLILIVWLALRRRAGSYAARFVPSIRT